MKVSYKNTSNNESYSEKGGEGGGGEFFLTPLPPNRNKANRWKTFETTLTTESS